MWNIVGGDQIIYSWEPAPYINALTKRVFQYIPEHLHPFIRLYSGKSVSLWLNCNDNNEYVMIVFREPEDFGVGVNLYTAFCADDVFRYDDRGGVWNEEYIKSISGIIMTAYDSDFVAVDF
jgi:hypothetical protein